MMLHLEGALTPAAAYRVICLVGLAGDYRGADT